MKLARVLPAALAAALVAGPAPARGQAPSGRILVMPFDTGREPSIVWLGEAASVLLADDLNAYGVAAIPRAERQEAFEQLQVPPVTTLTDATVIRIGQLLGAAEVVTGSVRLDGEVLSVHARGVALVSGRISHTIDERGSAAELFAIFDRIARAFAPEGAAAAGRQMPPLAAFESYIKGLLAETSSVAVAYLRAALEADPTYDRARLALWDVYADQGDHAQALAALKGIAEGSEWALRAKFLSGLSYLNLRRYDEAVTAFEFVASARPSAPALNNLGVVHIRRGGAAQAALAADAFKRASEIDAADPDYFFNLGYACWMARDYQASIYWLRQAVRRNPADGDAHFVLGAALAAGGSPVEAARERELARRLSSTYEQWERRPAGEVVPKGLERVKSAVELPHQALESTLLVEQRDQQEVARFHVDRARRLFQQENDREAAAELNRAIFLAPYDAEAHLLLARIHLRNNRVRDAIDALKVSLWSEETAAAHVALGEAYVQMKDLDAAKAEAERALALEPGSPEAGRLLAEIRQR